MKITIKTKEIKRNLSALIIGFLFFGPYASILFENILHFPMVIPEFIYIPLLFTCYRKFGLSLKKRPNFGGVLLIWLFYLAFAFLWGTYDAVAILSTARSFLVVGLFVVLGTCVVVDRKLLIFLLYLSLGSIFGWCISSALNFIKMFGLKDESVVYGNMIAIAYAFSILFLYYRNLLLLVFLFGMNALLSFTTALRRQIMVSLLSIGSSLSLLTVKYKKTSYIAIVVLLLIPIYMYMPTIEDYVREANPYLHHRIFERSEQVLDDNLQTADQGRINHQLYIFTKMPEMIIPHGYISQHTSKDNTGIFNDVPTYMLAYTFGVFVFYYYILVYLRRLFITLKRFILYDNEYYGVLLVVALVTLFLHFVEAAMFIYTYTCPFTGLTIGLIFRRDYVKLDYHNK